MEVSPSLLAADFTRLGDAVEIINRSEASMIHVDVMDGMFVPNISIGFPMIKAIADIAEKPLDVHMMVMDPIRFISQVRDAGATIMNVHQEACIHLNRVIHRIKEAGMKPAVTLNPATPLVMLDEILPELDMVLLMGVNPGFGGQKFIEATLDKVARLREMIDRRGLKTKIEVDGGVNLATAPLLAHAGADVLVAGSFVFNAADPVKAISTLAHIS
ncbi:MAG: ribulose-phosphate 3-epimerase [Bacteroides sp.]|nr:ribulose-phosphate 3-epimerase [Bacteroidales bacterium]MBD5250832.1 ribulose-phosphate 3-epimerase [Barnesiella sp.]MBD5368217.1 ribulose-phosphate 3-epimerase [Bacteroides sp.]